MKRSSNSYQPRPIMKQSIHAAKSEPSTEPEVIPLPLDQFRAPDIQPEHATEPGQLSSGVSSQPQKHQDHGEKRVMFQDHPGSGEPTFGTTPYRHDSRVLAQEAVRWMMSQRGLKISEMCEMVNSGKLGAVLEEEFTVTDELVLQVGRLVGADV